MNKKMLESQCISIIMSSLTESDKKEGLELLIYDEESREIVNNFMDYLILD